jgi:hypothetical protein
MDRFLKCNRILYKDFTGLAKGLSDQLKRQAEATAQKSSRPYVYLNSSSMRKDQLVKETIQRDRIEDG